MTDTTVAARTTAAQRIAAFTAGLSYDALPAEVVEKAKVTLLHNLGVALAAGSMAETAVAYAGSVAAYEGAGGSRLLVSGQAVSPFTAAYVNAALIHARAQDDVYFPALTHVGATIIPALLAVGEKRDSTGKELLTAMVAGYEAAGAIGQGFALRTTARGFRATGLYGVFGAAAAVARLLGLDAAQTVDALGVAACMASGTNQTWVAGTQEWQFQVGIAARNGIGAALQAAAGGSGAPDSLEGPAGFYASFMGDTEGVGAVGADLGTDWRIHNVTYKPYPVCAILQAPVAELVALMARNDLTAGNVDTVRLVLSPPEFAYPGTDSTGPFAGVGATLMSARYCLAVGVLEGRVTAADLSRQDDPAVTEMINRVGLAADPALGARSFRLQLDTVDGNRLEHAFTATTATYNWDRGQVVEQLHSMQDEMPTDKDGIDRLAAVTLSAEEQSVREVVSAAICGA